MTSRTRNHFPVWAECFSPHFYLLCCPLRAIGGGNLDNITWVVNRLNLKQLNKNITLYSIFTTTEVRQEWNLKTDLEMTNRTLNAYIKFFSQFVEDVRVALGEQGVVSWELGKKLIVVPGSSRHLKIQLKCWIIWLTWCKLNI